MFTIGDFARYGRVSVRMLRHYDAIGLLRPARVDPTTGYRQYDVGQLWDLNQIVALKDLGFSLEQVRTMRDQKVGTDEVRAMLTVRQSELESEVAERRDRLAQVETRLRALQIGTKSDAFDVVIKTLEAIRLVALSTTAASFTPEDIGPVVHPLCAELGRRLAESTVRPVGRLICYYERAPDSEDEVQVHAGVPADVRPGDDLNGMEVTDLPATRAATTIHRGPMTAVLPAWQALGRWVNDNGHHPSGPSREFYLDCPDDQSAWITELQEPIG